MARSINKVFLIGNLGVDPEALRYTPEGVAVVNISVATNESWKDNQTGEQQQRTEWHRVVLYARLAEIVQQYLRKGSKVWIEGRLQTDEWKKEGQKQTTKIIIAKELLMLDSRGVTAENPWEQATPSSSKPMGAQAPSREDVFDDDIPF